MNDSIKVLLIEDNPGDARLIQEMLKEAGSRFDFKWADTLSTGLERLVEEVFDVLLLDLGLPDSQGIDTFTRAHAQAAQIPIIVLTGLADETIAMKAVREGLQDYLMKGQIDSNLLVRGIRYAIERKRAEEEIRKLNAELEWRVRDRTTQLEAANKELEAFSYSVSHDLRAPLRSIDGFSEVLLEDYQDKLDDTAKSYLDRVRKATQHMGRLIDDMLKLSRVTRSGFHHASVDMSTMVREISEKLQQNDPVRTVDVIIREGVFVNGDSNLLKIALENLVNNAWKFTSKEARPQFEFGTTVKEGKTACFIRDNGVGFDMTYVNKLFGAFQRLHTSLEFPGTGIGLATVQRIINRHGGQVWAEAEVGKGATFYFTLPG